MKNLFSNVKEYQDSVKANSKSSVLAKLKTEMAITKLELKAYKNQIKQAESELAKITVNLEKTKLEFEQLLTQQMIKKKNILQLEKEHKFILTELALFAKHNKEQLVEKTTNLEHPLYPLIKKAILKTMKEQINKEYKTRKELESFDHKPIYQKYQNEQNINTEERFLYYQENLHPKTKLDSVTNLGINFKYVKSSIILLWIKVFIKFKFRDYIK